MAIGEIILNYESDREIIEGYLSGDREKAAAAFVNNHREFVFSIAFRYLKDYDDAEDLAQEIFVKALKNADKFRGDSSIKTWLYRIAVNAAKNAVRKKKLRSIFSLDRLSGDEENDESYEPPSLEPNPEQTYQYEELKNRFYEILAELPEKQRETFALRYFENMPYSEISKLLGTSEGGLKANYYQATKKIAEILNKEFDYLIAK